MRKFIFVIIIIYSYSSHANQYDAAVGYCKIVMPGAVREAYSAYYQLLPASTAGTYISDFRKDLDFNKINKDFDNAKITVLQPPSHGVLVGEGDLTNYHPHAHYDGKDSAIFFVEVGGYKIKVVYYIYVGGVGNNEMEYCPNNLLYQELPTTDSTNQVSVKAVTPVEKHE